MHPRVRALYKEFLLLGPQLPPTLPMHRYRELVKAQFRRRYRTKDNNTNNKIDNVNSNLNPALVTSSTFSPEQPNLKQQQQHAQRLVRKVETSDELKRSLAWGRYRLREVQTVVHVHKFRHLKKHYDSDSPCGLSSFSAAGQDDLKLLWQNDEVRRRALIDVRTTPGVHL